MIQREQIGVSAEEKKIRIFRKMGAAKLKNHIYLELTSEQVPVRLLYLTEKAESLQLQMVLIRYIIRMRDGRSRILKNGGAQSARQQRKRYRKPESHQKKSPEWELTDRAGRQSQ